MRLILLLLLSFSAFADTPPPNSVKAKVYDGTGTTAIGNVSDSLKVNVTNATTSSPLYESIIVGGVAIDPRARTWSLSSGSDSVSCSVSSSTLPTNAATESTLSAINTKIVTTANGIKVDGSAVTQPVSGTVTANAGANLNTSALALESGGHLASVDTKLSTINTTLGSPFQAGGSIGNTAFIANAGTNLNTSALALESGGHLASVDTKITTTANGIKVDGSAVTQPVSGAVSVSNFPASQVVSQATASSLNATVVQSSGANLHVNVDSAPTTSVTQGTSPWVTSGTVTANQGTANSAANAWMVKNTDGTNVGAVKAASTAAVATDPALVVAVSPNNSVAVTQASGANLHVNVDSAPTTAVTGTVTANQGTSPWVSNVSQFGGSAVVTGTGTSGAGIPRVTVSSDSSLTANIGTTNGLALDATVAKLTITQGTALGSNTVAMVGGSVTTNNPAYSTGGVQPLSITTRGGLRTKEIGFEGVQLVRNDYSTTNVTTAAYTQLIASTAADINYLMIFDSSGQDFVLATGAAASEVDQIQIPPGGWDSPIKIFIASGTRVSIKSKSATASSGILLVTAMR